MPLKPSPLPPIEIVSSLFDCDFKTGIVRNRISRTTRVAGERSDRTFRSAYRVVSIGGHLFNAHRVIWAIANGRDTKNYIDHKNGNKDDNRLENLRECTHAQNMRNKRSYSNNTSGSCGVHKRKDNGKWRAFVSVSGKRTNLGQFETFEEADVAAKRGRIEKHQEFARAV